MTPRNENPLTLTDLLLQQMQAHVDDLDFRTKKNIVGLIPPRVMESQLSGKTTLENKFENYHINTFKNLAEAQSFSSLPVTAGTPAAVGLFLREKPAEILWDFSPLGLCLLSSKTSVGNSDPALVSWIHYALSPELWGPEGKWIRFHQRLHTVFSAKNLLNGQDFPGYYPLNKSARTWEKDGLLGDEDNGSVNLTLPWSFPLSGLVKLERLLQQS